MKPVMVNYTYACDAYCTTRWGEPSDEIIPATCPSCAKKKLDHEANRARAYKKHLKNTYEKHGKHQAKKKKRRIAKAAKEQREEEAKFAHLLTRTADALEKL